MTLTDIALCFGFCFTLLFNGAIIKELAAILPPKKLIKFYSFFSFQLALYIPGKVSLNGWLFFF